MPDGCVSGRSAGRRLADGDGRGNGYMSFVAVQEGTGRRRGAVHEEEEEEEEVIVAVRHL